MKKRLLSTLLMFAMMFSLSGCNNSDGTYDMEYASEKTSYINEDVTIKNSNTTTIVKKTTVEKETTTFAIEEPYFEILDITNEPVLENGYMRFWVDKTLYVYNISENKMYTFTDWGYYDYMEYINNKVAIISVDNIRKVINIETSEVIISDTDDDIRFIYDNDTILVSKFEESFSGNKNYFGIIGTDGKWLYELSDKYSFEDTYGINAIIGGTIIFNGSRSSDDKYIYSFETDTSIPFDDDVDIKCINKDIYISKPYESLKHIDGYTGDVTIIYENDEYTYIEVNSITDSYISIKLADEEYYYTFFLDRKTLEVINVRLPENKVTNFWAFDEGTRVFTALNPDEIPYIVIADKDDNILGEPIKDYEIYTYYNECYLIDNTFINVYGAMKDEYFILNGDTGEIITHNELPYNFNFWNNCFYDNISRLFCVEYEKKYYLIDARDPYTLINPFERVNGY